MDDLMHEIMQSVAQAHAVCHVNMDIIDLNDAAQVNAALMKVVNQFKMLGVTKKLHQLVREYLTFAEDIQVELSELPKGLLMVYENEKERAPVPGQRVEQIPARARQRLHEVRILPLLDAIRQRQTLFLHEMGAQSSE